MRDPSSTDEDLKRLGKKWFAEARQKSAQDDADFDAWDKERRKWTPLGYYGGPGGYWGSTGDSGDSGGGSGGGDGGGGD
jgi:hypothetical protein